MAVKRHCAGVRGLDWAATLRRALGTRLRDARAHRPKPLSQQELADLTKGLVLRSTIASIERGLQGVSVEQLFILARALELEPRDLLPATEAVFARGDDRVRALMSLSKPDVARFLRSVQR